MAIEPDYLDLFSERITIVPFSGSVNVYGRRTFTASAAFTACAHLMAEARLDRTATANDGRTVVETGRALVYGTPSVTVDDLLILAASTASATAASPVIIGVDVLHDDNGAHHTVIRFGQ